MQDNTEIADMKARFLAFVYNNTYKICCCFFSSPTYLVRFVTLIVYISFKSGVPSLSTDFNPYPCSSVLKKSHFPFEGTPKLEVRPGSGIGIGPVFQLQRKSNLKQTI